MLLSEKVNILLITIIIALSVFIYFTSRESADFRTEAEEYSKLVEDQRGRINDLEKANRGFEKAVSNLSNIYNELQEVKLAYKELERRGEERLRREEARLKKYEKLEQIAGGLNFRLERSTDSATSTASTIEGSSKVIEGNSERIKQEVSDILKELGES